MIVERGNIKLCRLTEEHIELVRQRRNAPEIQKRMEYREHITPEMQLDWFNKINNVNNNYFLIETNDKFIGLINGENVEWDTGITNNGGIFIWDNDYMESIEILQATLLLTDLGYYLGLKNNYIRVLRDNLRAIAFNTSLGYKLLPGQEQIYNQKYELTANSYFKATEKIRLQFGLSGLITLSVTKAEYASFIGLIKGDSKLMQNILIRIIG